MKYLPWVSAKTFLTTVGIFFFGLFLLANSSTLLTLVQPKQELAEVKPIAKRVDAKQLKCLATNIFFEAGSESEAGKAAVARVVMNRVKHGFGSTPCSVVYQTAMVSKSNENTEGTTDTRSVKLCQFSWVCEGKNSPHTSDPRYKQSEHIAYRVLAFDDYKNVIPSTVLFFHNLMVSPSWPHKRVIKIGNHIFYEKTSKHKRGQKKVIVADAN
jgi:spore germination cell wall hydrolase CwlJ-like protein